MTLIERTLFGDIDMVQVAIDRLREFEPPEGYYGAFSGWWLSNESAPKDDEGGLFD